LAAIALLIPFLLKWLNEASLTFLIIAVLFFVRPVSLSLLFYWQPIRKSARFLIALSLNFAAPLMGVMFFGEMLSYQMVESKEGY